MAKQTGASLAQHMSSDNAHKCVRVTDPDDNILDISFKRTIRVPDNGKPYQLPPDHGSFPLYSVRTYSKKLPLALSAKGGIFLPIYQREALWIHFKTEHLFAIKIFVGGVNAISGESKADTVATALQRQVQLSEGKSVQDYVVTKGQLWVDGIVKSDGTVMQFVATPVGTGYSVEAQLTGQDSIAGIQFEIMVPKIDEVIIRKTEGLKIIVRSGWGQLWKFKGLKEADQLSKIMDILQDTYRINLTSYRLTHEGRRFSRYQTIADLEMEDGDVIDLTEQQLGGGRHEHREMAVAPGGLIRQTIVKDPLPAHTWDTENTVMFNVRLINAAVFKDLVGIDPPRTPISAKTYAEAGYPFFALYEEPSGISGDFPVKSWAQMDEENSNSSDFEKEEHLEFPTIMLNTIDKKSEFLPVSEIAKRVKGLNIVSNF